MSIVSLVNGNVYSVVFSLSYINCFLLQLVEGAIRCFVSLVDRFTRRGHNTDLLTSKGLLSILIGRLRATPPKESIGVGSGQKTSVMLTSSIINLLVIFCRRSKSATEVHAITYTVCESPSWYACIGTAFC